MWVKICGVRDLSTAEQVCRLLPDAIGLNFYAGSVRSVDRKDAAQIADVAGSVRRVGVFVNHSASQIEDLAGECRLDAVQIHGDESPQQLADIARRLPAIPCYRAWRIATGSLEGLDRYLAECQLLGCVPAGCLVDAGSPGSYGGTGQTVPWDVVARDYQRSSWPPLVLAGGLKPQNVAEAIRMARPWGVDVASGVESAPGVKDLQLVRQFIENARATSAS